MPEKFVIASGAMGPFDKDVMAQLNIAHPLQISESKVIIYSNNYNTTSVLNCITVC